MLSEHAQELEADELISRIQFDDKLQRVEYGLSDKRNSLLPIPNQLQNRGRNNIKNVVAIQEMVDGGKLFQN